jgi:predicted RNA-binding Zn ribbon-like protein
VAAGLLGADSPLRPAELTRARELRDSIRSLLASEGDEKRRRAQLRPLQDLIQTHRARLTIDDRGTLSLENSNHDELADGLFDLLLIMHRAQEDGGWTRLKACANPECRWVFYDRSRNRQGSWCDMAVCGNRLKNRSLRARRR